MTMHSPIPNRTYPKVLTPIGGRPNARRASFDSSPSSAFGRTNFLLSSPSDFSNPEKSELQTPSRIFFPQDISFKKCSENRKRRAEDVLDDCESLSSFTVSETKIQETLQTSHKDDREQENDLNCISPFDTPSLESMNSFSMATPGRRQVPLTVLPFSGASPCFKKRDENAVTPSPSYRQRCPSISLTRRKSKSSPVRTSDFQSGKRNENQNEKTSRQLNCPPSFSNAFKKNTLEESLKDEVHNFRNCNEIFRGSSNRFSKSYSVQEDMVDKHTTEAFKSSLFLEKEQNGLSLFSATSKLPTDMRYSSPISAKISMGCDTPGKGSPCADKNVNASSSSNTASFFSSPKYCSHVCDANKKIMEKSPAIDFKKCILESPIASSDVNAPPLLLKPKKNEFWVKTGVEPTRDVAFLFDKEIESSKHISRDPELFISEETFRAQNKRSTGGHFQDNDKIDVDMHNKSSKKNSDKKLSYSDARSKKKGFDFNTDSLDSFSSKEKINASTQPATKKHEGLVGNCQKNDKKDVNMIDREDDFCLKSPSTLQSRFHKNNYSAQSFNSLFSCEQHSTSYGSLYKKQEEHCSTDSLHADFLSDQNVTNVGSHFMLRKENCSTDSLNTLFSTEERVVSFSKERRIHEGNCSTDSLNGLGFISQFGGSCNDKSLSVRDRLVSFSKERRIHEGNCSTDSLNGLAFISQFGSSCNDKSLSARDLITPPVHHLLSRLSPPLLFPPTKHAMCSRHIKEVKEKP